MRALTPTWWEHHRGRMSHWHHDRLDEILHDLATMQAEIQQLLHERDTTPTNGTITATTEAGIVSDTYAPGQTIYLTAGAFTNAEGQPVTTPVTGTWTSDQGTITANPNNPDEATLTSVPLGPVNVTFTAGAMTLTYQADVVDQTPVNGTITGSTTPPSDEPTPATN